MQWWTCVHFEVYLFLYLLNSRDAMLICQHTHTRARAHTQTQWPQFIMQFTVCGAFISQVPFLCSGRVKMSKQPTCTVWYPTVFKINLPKQELTKPYHIQPCLPYNQRAWILDAKLRVVPQTHTSMSLTLILRSSMLTGVRKVLNLQNRINTIRLLRKPNIIIDPRNTETTVCPVRDSLSAGVSFHSWSRNDSGSSLLEFELKFILATSENIVCSGHELIEALLLVQHIVR